MQTITKYELIQSTDPSVFCGIINKHIQNGYQPLGSVQICNRENVIAYVQIIVKYEEK